jgi:hypothetical protein
MLAYTQRCVRPFRINGSTHRVRAMRDGGHRSRGFVLAPGEGVRFHVLCTGLVGANRRGLGHAGPEQLERPGRVRSLAPWPASIHELAAQDSRSQGHGEVRRHEPTTTTAYPFPSDTPGRVMSAANEHAFHGG